MVKVSFLWFLVVVSALTGVQCRKWGSFKFNGYSRNILFNYYTKDGDIEYSTNVENPKNYMKKVCDVDGKYAIIVPGWKESCKTEWVGLILKNVIKYRGGCIMCMDYSRYSNDGYARLLSRFDQIASVLAYQLWKLHDFGFSPERAYIFGFSFGAQLATESGRLIGPNLLKEIDACDPAGPGFDRRVPLPKQRDAAQNVQCIHTSIDKGTRVYNCHQDWRMGYCGYHQAASTYPPYRSHGLCPYIYASGFTHDFEAIAMPHECSSRRLATFVPDGFKMGYRENRKTQVNGELFAYTGSHFPYNGKDSYTAPEEPDTEWDYVNIDESLNRTTPITDDL